MSRELELLAGRPATGPVACDRESVLVVSPAAPVVCLAGGANVWQEVRMRRVIRIDIHLEASGGGVFWKTAGFDMRAALICKSC